MAGEEAFMGAYNARNTVNVQVRAISQGFDQVNKELVNLNTNLSGIIDMQSNLNKNINTTTSNVEKNNRVWHSTFRIWGPILFFGMSMTRTLNKLTGSLKEQFESGYKMNIQMQIFTGWLQTIGQVKISIFQEISDFLAKNRSARNMAGVLAELGPIFGNILLVTAQLALVLPSITSFLKAGVLTGIVAGLSKILFFIGIPFIIGLATFAEAWKENFENIREDVENLKEGFETGDWEKIIDSIGNIVIKIIDKFQEIWGEILFDVGEFIGSLIAKIVRGLIDLDWGKLLKDVATVVFGLIKGAIEFLISFPKWVFGSIESFVGGFVKGMNKVITESYGGDLGGGGATYDPYSTFNQNQSILSNQQSIVLGEWS